MSSRFARLVLTCAALQSCGVASDHDSGAAAADASEASVDGGLDAGEGRDSGPGDAGPMDAGPVDAGPDDAGSVDAGPVDAGPDDAGPDDAGPVDAGLSGADGGLGYDPTQCQCTREIMPSDRTVNLGALGPGSVVCLRASTASARGPLTLTNLAGTPANPVLIRNCDGAVTFTSTTTATPLSLSGTGFRVSGGGAPGVPWGMRFTGPAAPFLVSVGRASHFELDHLEIFDSGFAGVTAKVDPSSAACNVGDRRYDSFVMQGVHLHHLWIHDMPAGEGIYLGNSFYEGAGARYCYAPGNTACDTAPCPGATEQFPHELRDVDVHHNLIENTGWDGIQIGSAVDGCRITDNRVERYGVLDVGSQNHGIQVGGGSSCLVERNVVRGGPKGMMIQGIGDVVVQNNIFDDFSQLAIEVNPRPTPLATDFVDAGYRGGFTVRHNTLVTTRDAGFAMVDINAALVGDVTGVPNLISNNLVVFPRAAWLRRTDSRYGWGVAGNLQFSSTLSAGLVDGGTGAFCLTPSSPARDVADGGLAPPRDFFATTRPEGPGFDVGATECP